MFQGVVTNLWRAEISRREGTDIAFVERQDQCLDQLVQVAEAVNVSWQPVTPERAVRVCQHNSINGAAADLGDDSGETFSPGFRSLSRSRLSQGHSGDYKQ